MPRIAKIALSVVIALLVTLGLGFAWGASGRQTAQNALDDLRLQLDLADARGHILEGRVSLYNVNFGDASRQFEDAKAPLGRARAAFDSLGKREAAQALGTAVERVQDAQRLAARLDQSANAQADAALKAVQAATRK